MWTSQPDDDFRRERLRACTRCHQSLEREVEGILEDQASTLRVCLPLDGTTSHAQAGSSRS